MDTETLKSMTSTRTTRTKHYAQAVPAYYEACKGLYAMAPTASFHFATFTAEQGPQDVFEACADLDRRLADEGRFKPGDKVLDLGCGIGGPALNIAAHSGASVTGINITPFQIEIAQARAKEQGLDDRVRFVEGDFMNMPFEDNWFDAAYALEAACHAPDMEALFREVARVVKPGGLFLGQDECCKNEISSEEYDEFIEPINRANALPHLLQLRDYSPLLSSAGFIIEVAESLFDRGNIVPFVEFLANQLHGADQPDISDVIGDAA